MEEAKIYIGNLAEFIENSRKLIKYGTRNIMIIYYRKKFYAMDNACYHHGGPLLNGDIEDFGGHLCIECPWHRYKIALDTGEGLYVSLELSSSGGKPKSTIRSKGCKQRVHKVSVDNQGEVYLIINLSGPSIESDRYATMEIANKEEPISTPFVHGKINNKYLNSTHNHEPSQDFHSRNPHSGFTRGQQFSNPILCSTKSHFDSSGFVKEEQWNRFGIERPRDSPKGEFMISCNQIKNVCENVCELFFVRHSGILEQIIRPGQYVELIIPATSTSDTSFLRYRKWTVCTVNTEDSLFSLIVKANTNYPSGASMWLHNYSLYTPLKVQSFGGNCTLIDHLPRICALQGRVLWLTAGIGITNAYAAIFSSFLSTDPAIQTIQYLHIVHLHVDRWTKCIPKLNNFVLHGCSGHREINEAGHKRLTFKAFLTQQSEPAATDNKEWETCITYGRRMHTGDVEEAVKREFLRARGFLVYICGPLQFINNFSEALLAMGVSEPDIITDSI
ncbi:unnamed protein product [Phytomonas sp. Hart1]|nr:unnamed protein product [Phytomonas sp. Hart1]|eukprot:CCW71001.1 unnamed protein product [Phytomonas sp. isolate Hart1]